MNRPQAGEFYRHYKYDPAGPEANFTYIIIGTGLHTEDRYETVIYKPLYKESGFLGECDYCVRPYDMFVETVTINGSEKPRFIKITDEREIGLLKCLLNTITSDATR
jgi:hypothetical protein